MRTVILILLLVLVLNLTGWCLKRNKGLVAFLFFHEEWRLMRIVERHAGEFNKFQFFDNGCLCIGHQRLKRIFLVIWVKPDRPLSCTLHQSNMTCVLSNYQYKRSRRLAEKIFTNIWKNYLLEEEMKKSS